MIDFEALEANGRPFSLLGSVSGLHEKFELCSLVVGEQSYCY